MYKLSVGGGLIDFIGEPKIILMTNNPMEYSFGKAHKTYYIDLLDTANNRKLLGNNSKVDALLYVEDLVYKGTLYIDGEENGFYRGQFVAGIGSVWDELRDKDLSDLDWSEYDHKLNKTNVDAYDAAFNPFVTYDLSDRGIRLKPIEQGDTAGDWLAYFRWWDLIERFPAFNIRKMLEKIFEGNDIVDNLPDDFDDIFLLYTGTYDLRNSEDWIKLSIFTSENTGYFVTESIAASPHALSMTGAIQNFNPVINEGGYIATPTYDKWTVPETGTYRVDGLLDIEVSIDDGAGGVFTNLKNGSATIGIARDGGILAPVNILQHQRNFSIATAASAFSTSKYLDARYIELTEGEDIYMSYAVTGTVTTTDPGALPATARLDFSSLCTFNITPHRWYGHNSTVEIAELMPDMGVLDFVKAICLYFNISIYYKETTKQVYLWLHDPDSIMDWSDKVLRNKDIGSELNESKRFKFLFKEEENDAIETPDEITIGEGEVQEVTMDFTEMGNYINIFGERGIPAILQGEKKDGSNKFYSYYDMKVDAGLKLAKRVTATSYNYRGNTDWKFTFANIGGTAGSVLQTKSTLPGFFSGDLALSGDDGIVNTYHRKTIETINDGAVMTCTVLLTRSDLLGLINMQEGKDWRSLIHIDGINYRLLELEQLEGNIYKGRFLQIF